MGVAASSEVALCGLLYRERADCYSAALSLAALERLRESARLVKYSTLQQQIRHTNLESVDLFVARNRPVAAAHLLNAVIEPAGLVAIVALLPQLLQRLKPYFERLPDARDRPPAPHR